MTVKIEKKIVGYSVADTSPKKEMLDNPELPLDGADGSLETEQDELANVVHML